MNATSAILVGAMFLAGLGWLVSVVIGRSCTLSCFRYRLWRVRDRLMDDILNGHLPDSDLLRDLLEEIEASIRHSRQITLFRWLLLPRAPEELIRRRRRFVEDGVRALNDAQRDLFCQHVNAFNRAIMRHLALGSVLGWVSVAIAVTVALVQALLGGVWKAVLNPLSYLKESIRRYGKKHIVQREQLWAFLDEVDDDDQPLAVCAG